MRYRPSCTDESEDNQLVDPNMTPGKRSLFVHEGFMQEMYGSKGRYAERDGSKMQVIG